MLFLYGNGSLITYLIFLGDFVPTIFQWFSPGRNMFTSSQPWNFMKFPWHKVSLKWHDMQSFASNFADLPSYCSNRMRLGWPHHFDLHLFFNETVGFFILFGANFHFNYVVPATCSSASAFSSLNSSLLWKPSKCKPGTKQSVKRHSSLVPTDIAVGETLGRLHPFTEIHLDTRRVPLLFLPALIRGWMIDTDRNILFGKCLWTSEALKPKRPKHITPPESTFITTKSHQSAKKS